jgi:hypothetical protein
MNHHQPYGHLANLAHALISGLVMAAFVVGMFAVLMAAAT